MRQNRLFKMSSGFFKPDLCGYYNREPLFVSSDNSNQWGPSFSKPIDPNVIREKNDTSFGLLRTEVRSRVGDAHLGHVFDDGPKELGGRRYCINSAALRFIPKEEMEREGYGHLLGLLE